uniref:CBM39 domain-containing protein n=1 Tax=Anopheles christyi TaxID=43041 RepID=A0A182KGQ8_9DIPT
MKQLITLITTLLLATVSVSSDAYENACKQFNGQIQIFRPQGLKIAAKHVSRNLLSIEVEVYINQEQRSNPTCDICANATVTGGRRKRFQIYHPSIVVLPGDRFQYTVTKRYRNGPPRQLSCEFRVNGERMLFSRPTQTRSCEENISTKNKGRQLNYIAEKRLLEETINEMLSSCEAADTTSMLILSGDYADMELTNELKSFIINRLRSHLPSVDWHGEVEDVYRTNGRLVFTVKTTLMKLKVLHLVRGTAVEAIVTDYDKQDRTTYDHEDYFDEDYGEPEIRTVKMSGKIRLLATIALMWLVAASCLLESVDARKSRGSSKRSSRRPKGVNIEIYHPKGVMVWYPYRSGMELFGIEIFINKANQQTGDSSEEDSTPPVCDICLNTTEVSYGKFILRSENAVIRNRDHVYYNAIVKKANGKAYISRSNEFYVSESRILLGDVTGTASACGGNTAVANLSDNDKRLANEIKLLEEILLEVNDQCHAGEQNRTKQLLLSAETPTRYDAKQLYQYVEEQLAQKLPTIDWNRTLVEAFYATDGIGFEVATTIDKLKVLKLAKALPQQPITDLDSFQTEDMTNDIDSWM